jgi:PleD family two-component response regulator
MRMVKSAGSRSTKIGVGKEGQKKGGTRRISGFTMAQKNPRSHAALVLIVDDDKSFVQVTAENFETLGCDVLTAQDGPKAVEILRSSPLISVLFTDNRCPEWEMRSLPRLR